MSEDKVHAFSQPETDKSNRQPELLVVMLCSLNLGCSFVIFYFCQSLNLMDTAEIAGHRFLFIDL